MTNFAVIDALISSFDKKIDMKKILSVIFLFSAFVATHKAFAKEDYKFINEMVSRYAEVTGCFSGQPLNPKLISKYQDKENEIKDAYIAIAYSDLYCAGGSGTTAATIVVLRDVGGEFHRGYYMVDTTLSEPAARLEGLPRSVTSIYQKNGQLFVTGLEYGKGDPNCCPSIKTIYKGTLHKTEFSLSKYDKRALYTWKFVKWKNY